MYKEVLRRNIRKIHTTPMGLKRIAKNLNIKEKMPLYIAKKNFWRRGVLFLKRARIFIARLIISL